MVVLQLIARNNTFRVTQVKLLLTQMMVVKKSDTYAVRYDMGNLSLGYTITETEKE